MLFTKKLFSKAMSSLAWRNFLKDYGYNPGYDQADAMASGDKRRQRPGAVDVMHEMREGDYRETQAIILQEDKAMKYEIRRNEAMYDSARDMYSSNYGYGG